MINLDESVIITYRKGLELLSETCHYTLVNEFKEQLENQGCLIVNVER